MSGTFEVRPSGGPLGADVAGFAADHATLDEIGRLQVALRRHLVLRLRDTALTDAAQAALSRQFRTLSSDAAAGDTAAGPPSAILRVTNMKNLDGTPTGVLGDGEVSWHTDGWFKERPFAVATLRALIVPAAGGDTHFSNMHAAYDTLPGPLRAAVAGRSIHHQTVYTEAGPLRPGMSPPANADIRTWPGVDHPIMRLPAGAGRPCLYLGRRKQACIAGLPLDESEAMLDALWHHATQDALIWTQHWRVGDVLIWDNRCVLHRRDAFDPNSARLLHRTSEVGERPEFARSG